MFLCLCCHLRCSSSPLPVPLEDEEEDGLALSRLLVSVLSTAASLKSDVFSGTMAVQTRVSVLLVLSSLVHTTGETLQTLRDTKLYFYMFTGFVKQLLMDPTGLRLQNQNVVSQAETK